MKRVLVLEDEEPIREFEIVNLERAGYHVIEASSGAMASEIIENGCNFDIALLDVMLPDADGFEICRKIREKSEDIGIIMLTARTMEQDKITGLNQGADDYITKPFFPAELTARVDALYRRVIKMKTGSSRFISNIIKSGPFIIDSDLISVKKDGKTVELTQIEFNILKYIVQNKGKAVSRESILKHVWGSDYYGELKIVDVNIRRLRMKIEETPSSPQYIMTIWGYGYKWGIE